MNSPQPAAEQRPRWKKWLRRSLFATLVMIAVVVLVRLTLPYSIIFGATTWLERQGIHSEIEDIRIDILGGKFSLINATGMAGQLPAFRIGLVDIHWLWRPLSEKVMHIERIALHDIDLDIEQYTDSLVVAGVTIPLGTETTPEPEPVEEADSISWSASLNQVDFANLDVCYQKYDSPRTAAAKTVLDYCTKFSALTWSGSIGYATDRELSKQDVPLVSEGDFSLSGFSITDRRLGKTLLHAGRTQLDSVAIRGLAQIGIDTIDMADVSALQRDDPRHSDAVRFSSLRVASLRMRNLNALDIDSIRLEAPGLYIARDAAGAWEYQQWVPVLADPGESAGSTPAKNDAFMLALHDIDINASDFCYDEAGGMYYCFNLDTLKWRGAAGIDRNPLYLRGDLQLAGMKIRNNTLQRDLLDIGGVSADGIDLRDIENVNLGSLVVDRLSALQRSERPDDQSLRFTRLELGPVAYTGGSRLGIDRINLEGIGLSLSLNADGSWEFDKWKPAPATETVAQAPDAVEPAEAGKQLDIVLGEFNLVTEQNVEFIDNSVTPPLDIGLSRLDFNIAQLDSDNAAQKSPFRLKAATKLRGTIELAGEISPFEAKPSFDAKGRITGLDLRVLTPETKKHIGHIIRSGQLDADLKLLSKDGQLDSNIALVLHHFEIKAMSKKDASELEKTFGMPINQSLSLLRDKDNSIHLEIPITGDVTAPDFDPTDAIIKATSKAAAFTLITFYTPYGLVFAGGNILFDLATALHFDPLLFDAGSTRLNPGNLEQLDKLATLMTERPQVHLTLCGLANTNDRLLLFPETMVTTDKSKPPASPAEQETRLQNLARERQENTKDYLVEKKNISHDRLILCEPMYDAADDAISGVEINI